jgi:hypothetical protein
MVGNGGFGETALPFTSDTLQVLPSALAKGTAALADDGGKEVPYRYCRQL